MTEPVLRNTTVMFALFNIGEGCLLVFLPHRAIDLGLGSGGYGYLVAALTGGELLATVLLARRPWRRSLLASSGVAQAIAAVLVVVLLVPTAATTLAVLVAVGMCGAPMTVWAQTLRMRLVPPEEHGRLFALLRTAMQATYPLGAGLAALTLGHGATVTVLAAAAFMGLPVLLTARSGRHVGWLHAADVSDRRADAGQRPTGRRQL
jgi:predicted MFS family arabinose efflux permease